MKTQWEKMVSGDELEEAEKERKKTKESFSVPNGKINYWEAQGYRYNKPGKTKTTVYKDKPFYDVFENQVWLVFKKMGFKIMNSDNTFFVDVDGDSKQLDVVAVDDDNIFVIECKSSETYNKECSFKNELEAIAGYWPWVSEELIKKYPNRRIQHIFATKNCDIKIDSKDDERLKKINSINFNYDTVLYFQDLANHLGKAAKYQLLGHIFQKENIKELATNIPCIKAKMGGVEYYSFSIEPHILLKTAYVLHRNNANILNFPTYQRLIKKDRLNSIRQFVSDGGYFPNNLIVAVDDDVEFKEVNCEFNQENRKIGILRLPSTYMSMYVIDGQHRLYGYSDSSKSKIDAIPVVAFKDLSKEEQVKMFMDVNENQKPVNKSLKNTLNADLLWKSDVPKKSQEALEIKIAEALGDDKDSPWFGQVVIAEESKTDFRCITTEAIKNALKDSHFLNSYEKQSVKRVGTFDKNSNDLTYPFLLNFLKDSVEIIKNKNIEEWNQGSKGNIAINNTVYGIINTISDIVDIKLSENNKTIADECTLELCRSMIEEFAEVIYKLDNDTKKQLKQYGAIGKKIAWRILEMEFNSKNPNFTTKELEAYIEANSTANNDEALRMLNELEPKLRSLFKKAYIKSEKKLKEFVGDSVARKMYTYESAMKYDAEDDEIEVDLWQSIGFDEISSIVGFGSNWTNFAKQILTNEDFENKKTDTQDWLDVFSSAKSRIANNKPVTKKDFNLIKDVYEHFIEVND